MVLHRRRVARVVRVAKKASRKAKASSRKIARKSKKAWSRRRADCPPYTKKGCTWKNPDNANTGGHHKWNYLFYNPLDQSRTGKATPPWTGPFINRCRFETR